MRYETLLTSDEKNKWLDLEVTIGTNDTLISQELLRLKKLLRDLDPVELAHLQQLTNTTFNLNADLEIGNNASLLKLLLIKKFVDQHGLSVIREVKNNPNLSEKNVIVDLSERYFGGGNYPEDIYVYATYRQRGTPNTWFKVINDETPDQIEQKIIRKTESLRRYINYHLAGNRKFKFGMRIQDLYLVLFSKPISPKVYKGENKNVEVQRSTYTILVFDRSKKALGVVSGSKKEVQLVQRYVRYKLYENDIATPRYDYEKDKNELLRKLLLSNSEANILLKGVAFKSTLLPSQPSMRLKTDSDESLDAALSTLENIWRDSGIEILKSVDYEYQGKMGTTYLYGDIWKRMYINVSAKRRSVRFENIILNELNQRLEVDVKEARFIIEPLTDDYVIERILSEKKIPTFPPVPEQVERILVKLVKKKLIKKTKLAKRKCQHCYKIHWEDWACPECDREEMTLVGEMVAIDLNEVTIIRQLNEALKNDFPTYQTTLIPYKQRRKYKKSVIRVYNAEKNISVFMFIIANKKDLVFAEDLLNEGFGVVALVDPDMLGKIDQIQQLGCDTVLLHQILNKIINGGNRPPLSVSIQNQEQRVLERIFSNLRTAVNRLENKPTNYNEGQFEIDLTNILQALVPDVVRLGTEYVGKKVPDGYCCYGYRNSRNRRRRRLFGWDAKYSYSANYRLATADLRKQKGYINWLTDSKKEPYKMGSLGIYGFISNFEQINGFDSVLTKLATSTAFPNQCRLVLIQDSLLVKVGQWLFNNWQQVIDNNSVSSEVFFKFIRRKRPNRQYNILKIEHWDRLKEKLDQSI